MPTVILSPDCDGCACDDPCVDYADITPEEVDTAACDLIAASDFSRTCDGAGSLITTNSQAVDELVPFTPCGVETGSPWIAMHADTALIGAGNFGAIWDDICIEKGLWSGDLTCGETVQPVGSWSQTCFDIEGDPDVGCGPSALSENYTDTITTVVMQDPDDPSGVFVSIDMNAAFEHLYDGQFLGDGCYHSISGGCYVVARKKSDGTLVVKKLCWTLDFVPDFPFTTYFCQIQVYAV